MDPYVVQTQKDAADEIFTGVVALVRSVKRRHGPDPELPMIVMAALARSLDELKLSEHGASAVFGDMLVDRWEKLTGRKFTGG